MAQATYEGTPVVEIRDDLEGATVLLKGEHDLTTAGEIRAALELCTASSNVVVELNDATFIDSSVIRELISGWRSAAAAGREYKVSIRSDHPIMRVLRIASLDQVLPIVSDD